MFLTNLNYLKEEINLELLRKNKIKHLFRSLTFICICPVFFLFPIEKWAVSNMTELSAYYRGAYGFVVKLFVFASVILGFQLVNRLQVNENVGLQLRKKM